MKLTMLLKAASSLPVHSNHLSRFNDRKYGTWKARHNRKALVRVLVDINYVVMKFF
ncbi:MAG: hypothetical protein ACRC7S_16360 [Cetobacterium sp.]|uniref:hypothetical protein n=1 Tax=Cetobacterium sp. ZWU0022 TaxID=1340502 RepID=UPI0012E01167|nr:hypothetical protein [Cetobacterium sp. ZWU0022]